MGKLRFRVVDGTTPDYDRFKEMYMDPTVSRGDILDDLGMSKEMYARWGRRVAGETGLIRRSWSCGFVFVPFVEDERVVRVPNYYCFNRGSGRWTVQKNLCGRQVHFGSYKTEAMAQKVVEFLKEHEWSKESLKEMKI